MTGIGDPDPRFSRGFAQNGVFFANQKNIVVGYGSSPMSRLDSLLYEYFLS